MKLKPVPVDEVLEFATLPYPLYTQDGLLLLSAHASLKDPFVRRRLTELSTVHVPCDADEPAAKDTQEPPPRPANGGYAHSVQPPHPGMPGDDWEQVVLALDRAMQAPTPDKPWLRRLLTLHEHIHQLAARRLDEALFHLFYTGGVRKAFYSSRQALRCMLVGAEAARHLGWDAAHVALVEKAALTMNATVWHLQDQLHYYNGNLDDPSERMRIKRHAVTGARLLQDSNARDPEWTEAVLLHHDTSLAERPLDELTPAQQIAVLLQRVDRYCAMLSRRARGQALSALDVVRQTCRLGPGGHPDQLAAVLIKAVGFYPPGTYVGLATQECGIVLARGRRANAPLVAALTSPEGTVMAEPLLRDTSERDTSVVAALPYGVLHLEPPLLALQALRMRLRAAEELPPKPAPAELSAQAA